MDGVVTMLNRAWICNYLLSKFGARKHLLTGNDWMEFLASNVANSTPQAVYAAITSQRLSQLQTDMLGRCTLSMCFFTEGGEPAPIVFPVEVPFLQNVPMVQLERVALLKARSSYAPRHMSQTGLNSNHDHYLDEISARVEKSTKQYESLRQTMENGITKRLGRWSKFGNQATENALDEQLTKHESEVASMTGKVVDYVEQAFFILMGMVEVIDFSDRDMCARFVEAYDNTPTNVGIYTQTMKTHSFHCERLWRMIQRFNMPADHGRQMDARDFAYLRLSFKGISNGAIVAPLAVPHEALKFAKKQRGRLFVICYGKQREPRVMLPADCFYTWRDLSPDSNDYDKIVRNRNSILGEAIGSVLTHAQHLQENRPSDDIGDIATIADADRTQTCKTVRGRALEMLSGANKSKINAFSDIIGDENTSCNSVCLSKDIDEALQQPTQLDQAKHLATSLMNYTAYEGMQGCDEHMNEELCTARVKRASAIDNFSAASTLGMSADVYQKAVCDQTGVMYSEFAAVAPNTNDMGKADAIALTNMAKERIDQNTGSCDASIQGCKRSDMATCLLTALVSRDKGDAGVFSNQFVACSTVRDDMKTQIEHTIWDNVKDIMTVSPCTALSQLYERRSTLSHAASGVLQKIYSQTCDTNAGIVPSSKPTGLVKLFEDAIKQKLNVIFKIDSPTGVRPSKNNASNAKNLNMFGIHGRDTLVPRETISMHELNRIIDTLSRSGDLPYERINIPFNALDLSALDMYLWATTVFTRTEVDEHMWNGRPLAWALIPHPSGEHSANSPANDLKADSDQLAQDTLGAMYAYTLFQCINKLSAMAFQLSIEQVTSAAFHLVKALSINPLDSLSVLGNIKPHLSFDTRNKPRHDFMKSAALRDYVCRQAVWSTTSILAMTTANNSLVNMSARYTMWINHFRLVISVSPLLSADDRTTSHFYRNTMRLVDENRADLRASFPFMKDRSQVLASLGIVGIATDDPFKPSTTQLIPVAGGHMLVGILTYVAKLQPVVSQNIWTIWTIVLMAIYNRDILQTSTAQNALQEVTLSLMNEPGQLMVEFDLVTLHLLYRILKFGGIEMDRLRNTCLARLMQGSVGTTDNLVTNVLQRIMLVEWVDGISEDVTTIDRAPYAIQRGALPLGLRTGEPASYKTVFEGGGGVACIKNVVTVGQVNDPVTRSVDLTSNTPSGMIPNIASMPTATDSVIINAMQGTAQQSSVIGKAILFLMDGKYPIEETLNAARAARAAAAVRAQANTGVKPRRGVAAGLAGTLAGTLAVGLAAGTAGAGTAGLLGGSLLLKSLYDLSQAPTNTQTPPDTQISSSIPFPSSIRLPWAYILENNRTQYITIANEERRHMLSNNNIYEPDTFTDPLIHVGVFLELLLMAVYSGKEWIQNPAHLVHINVVAEGSPLHNVASVDQTINWSLLSPAVMFGRKLNEITVVLYALSAKKREPASNITTSTTAWYNSILERHAFDNNQTSWTTDVSLAHYKEQLDTVVTEISAYAELVRVVGVVFAALNNNNNNGRTGTKLDDTQKLEAARIMSQLKKERGDFSVDMGSDIFKNVTCSPFFDIPCVMCTESKVIPYELIDWYNGEEIHDVAAKNAFARPIVQFLYTLHETRR